MKIVSHTGMKNRYGDTVSTIISTTLLLALAFVFLFPLYWMFIAAFQPSSAAIQIPPNIFPKQFTMNNFEKLFTKTQAVVWLFNSIIVAGMTTILTLIFSSMSGYVFAKKKFPGRIILFWILLSAMMAPKQVMLVPLYIQMNVYNLNDTYAGMFMPMVAYPLGLFLMRQFMQSIPDDLITAARIDGAGEFTLFFKIVIPLSLPAFGAVGILYFIQTWNDYLWQLIIMDTVSKFTLPVGISLIAKQEFSIDYGLMMSGAVFGAVPMIVIFMFLQKYFIRGVTVGAIKG